MSDIRAEIEIDPQHGPIIRVHVNGRVVSVYLMHENGVVTEPVGSQYGIEVKGPWWKFRQMMETPELGADDNTEIQNLRESLERMERYMRLVRHECSGLSGLCENQLRSRLVSACRLSMTALHGTEVIEDE